MTKVMITLKDEDQHFIETAMKTGRYVTESEAVADAISELRAREELRQARLSELRAKVKVGIDQLDRGEGTEWNVAEVKAKGRALLASQKAAA
jgi:putative addiction module CopG family antidote